MKKGLYVIFVGVVLLVNGFDSSAQEWQNLIVEQVLSYKGYMARIRPAVYSVHSNLYRFDLMVGRQVFKPFTVLAYWKLDDKNRNRLGVRTDLRYNFLDNKLRTNMQFRYFWGLNEKSTNQYYFIPSVGYQVAKSVNVGLWCFGTSSGSFERVYAFCGPNLTLRFTKWCGAYFSYTKDWNSPIRLFYGMVFFNYRFKSASSKPEEKTQFDVHEHQ